MISSLNGSSEVDERAILKLLFVAFMHCDDHIAAEQIASIVERISLTVSLERNGDDIYVTKNQLELLILRLHSDFPGDRGVLAPLILNYIELLPGQAFFMGPNEPHAYLSGDCVECMALSDNVVRAGLTPKFKDVETLCDMLHYR